MLNTISVLKDLIHELNYVLETRSQKKKNVLFIGANYNLLVVITHSTPLPTLEQRP